MIKELRSRGAQFLDAPRFWTVAYERAASQLTSMQRHPIWRMEVRDTLVSGAYTKLLLSGSPPRVVQLGYRQDLLASVIFQWTLPMAQSLQSRRHYWGLMSRVPFQDQLDAIRRAAPQHEMDVHNLCHSDFMDKGCFWAGVNCILGKLLGLVNECLKQVHRQLPHYEHKRGDKYPSASSVFPFRWAFEDFLDSPLYRERYWEDELRTQAKRSREPWNLRSWEFYAGNQRHPDTPAMMSYMYRSDLIAMELMQQRQRQRQLEDMLQHYPLADRARRDRDGREGDVRQVLESASRAGVWVTSDILDLVKTLVECGDRCARYQDAVEDSAAMGYREHVEDLTFELFSTVIRLALVLDSDDHRIDFEKLAQPIQLLTTVRMARIKELDAICEGGLVPKHVCTNVGIEMGCGLEMHVEKMAEAIAGQVEKVIGDKLATVNSDMVCDIQRSIKEEAACLMEETRKDLEQKVQGQVKSEVAKAQVVQPPHRAGLPAASEALSYFRLRFVGCFLSSVLLFCFLLFLVILFLV